MSHGRSTISWCSREGERASSFGRHVEVAREFTRGAYDTVKRVHGETDLMGVFADTAKQIGGFDNKYLLFDRFLDVATSG